jgi:hypothetical protein
MTEIFLFLNELKKGLSTLMNLISLLNDHNYNHTKSNLFKPIVNNLTHFVPRTSACSFAEFYSVDRARARARS